MLPFVFFTILSQINIIIYSRDNIKSEKIKGCCESLGIWLYCRLLRKLLKMLLLVSAQKATIKATLALLL